MAEQEGKKKRITAWLSDSSLKKCKEGMILSDCKSRSDFVEKAVCFYSGYLSAQEHADFFASVISDLVESTISSTENRIARLLFKIAVELAKLEQMLASINDMDDETMKKLHIRCVNEVKRINGIIKMEEAVNFQRTKE